jgi:ElaB/YqjD/DUF883 family membrane-anchored ribosome-binding protein
MNQISDLRNDAQKDPETLEREIDQTRAQMNQTLGAIERKFSPGQLVDEALGLFREHGGDFTANLGNSIKQNPLPVMLAAVGIGWMICAPNRQSSVMGYGYSSDYSPNDEGRLGGVGESIKSRAADATEKLKTGAAATRDRLADSWASSKDAVMTGMSETASTAQAQIKRASDGFSTLLQEQPIIAGALGLAIGAAIGAMLPSTEHEDRLLGPTRDKAISQIKERGAEAYDRVRDTAENVVQKVQQASENAVAQTENSRKDRDESNSQRNTET